VNVDHAAQLRLLEVQDADTDLAQLAHRRATLPELATLAERTERAQALGHEIVESQTRIDDVAAEQRRLEDEVDTVRARQQRNQQRLDAGGVPAKELEGLQHELTSLARRQSTLEDGVLELMEQREQAEQQLAGLRAEADTLAAGIAELEAARDRAFAEIDATAAQRGQDRAGLAEGVPAELMDLYEKARAHGGGVGAAALKQRRCEGCRIELSGTELARVRDAEPDQVIRCEECRRILVRTPESGL
jgi:predicted  nucleic acid-binding Zn-ribbon protein